MKKFKKEILAILCGFVFAYAWQLFALLMCYISDSNSDFITADMFIPVISIQLAAMPIVTWALFGLLKVNWFKKWVRITMCGMSFLIPFVLISVITVIICPSLWREPIYWIGNVLISFSLTFTLFRPLLQVK